MQAITVIITDLDNTLFDWVSIWYRSFKAMLDSLVTESGVPEEVLKSEFKEVFKAHGTSEYAFAIQELPSLRKGDEYPEVRYKSAIDAFRRARSDALELYPTVLETLETLKDRGCLIVAYTESMAFYSKYRIRHLGLDRLLDYLYSPPDHDLPEGLQRKYPPERYALRRTIERHTPKGGLKPNPALLASIISDVGARANEVVYVGDSLVKDIRMAQAAGVTDMWAKYGTAQDRDEYALLRAVTHWPDNHVQAEREITADQVQPRYVLKENFGELLNHFSFGCFVGRAADGIAAVVEAWKQTVEVQQHFNDLELRIRNYAVTVLVAIIAAAVAFMREHIDVSLFHFEIQSAALVLFAGLVGWTAFYFMDRWWYHNLLYGAVQHGEFIEKRWNQVIPEIGLTEAISAASPLLILGRMRLRSTGKINLFYGAVGLMIIMLIVAVVVGKSNPANSGKETATPAASEGRTPSPSPAPSPVPSEPAALGAPLRVP